MSVILTHLFHLVSVRPVMWRIAFPITQMRSERPKGSSLVINTSNEQDDKQHRVPRLSKGLSKELLREREPSSRMTDG